jgi:hypothetical protein
MANDFDVDTNDLEGEFERSPAVFARLSEVYVEAFNTYSMKKIQFESEESRLRMLVRETMTAEAEIACQQARNLCRTATERGAVKFSKPTVDEINDVLRTTPAYTALREDLLMAEVRMKQAKVLSDAARFKKDMLTNLGHHHNSHMRNLVPPRAVAEMVQAFVNSNSKENH